MQRAKDNARMPASSKAMRVARVRECYSDCERDPVRSRTTGTAHIPRNDPRWQPAYNDCTSRCSPSGWDSDSDDGYIDLSTSTAMIRQRNVKHHPAIEESTAPSRKKKKSSTSRDSSSGRRHVAFEYPGVIEQHPIRIKKTKKTFEYPEIIEQHPIRIKKTKKSSSRRPHPR